MPQERRAAPPPPRAAETHAGELLDELRASEERYRALALATSQMVWRTGPDGAVVHNTDAWREQTGQSQADSNGWGWLDVVHPEDRATTLAAWTRHLRDGSAYEQTYRILAGEDWRWVLARAVPVRGEDGRLREWVGTTIDVHDAHEAARDREALLDRLTGALRRVTVLQGLTAALAVAEDIDSAAGSLVRFLRDEVGLNTVAVYVPEDDGGLRLVGTSGYPDWTHPVFARVPAGAAVPIARAHAEQRTITVTAASLEGEVVQRIIADTGNRVMCAMPLQAGGAPAGALTLGFDDRDSLDDATAELLDAIAGQVAQTLQRVLAAERLQEVAVGLQQGLSPHLVREVPGVEVAAVYRAGGDDVELVGGDWYDVVPLDDGRLLVVVGDVMGRGVQAATTMASTSAALRALAHVDPDPGVLVQRLDTYAARHAEEQFITLFCGLLDPRTGLLRSVLAGHVPPVLVRAGHAQVLTGTPQPPLALAASRTVAEHVLAPDDVLVVVTDGVVETRTSSAEDGLVVVCAALDGRTLDASSAAELVARSPEPSDDDATVLALRLR